MDVEELARAAVGDRLVSVAPLAGGYSAAVWRLELADPVATVVLRRHRTPVGPAIEAAVSRRLAGIAPVPEVLAGLDAPEPLTVTRWVDGDRLADVLPGADPATARALGDAVGRTLAAIGTVRFPAAGFFTDGDLTVDAADGRASDQLVGFADDRLGRDPTLAAYLDLIRREATVLDELAGPACLVHADYNPKNLLVHGTAVSAVLDWEFTLAGSPLTDVANMLRHPEALPAGYQDGFVAGFRAGGGELPAGWEKQARVLDVFALVDFLATDRALTPAARAIADRCVDRGWI